MKTGYVYFKAGIFFLYTLISSSFVFSQATSTHVFQEWFKNEGLTDHAYKAKSVFDNTGALYVVGGTINGNGDWDWLITKYDAYTNAELWTIFYDHSGLNDYATDVVIDSDCNLYITGALTNDTAMGLDLGIVKFDSTGSFQWVNDYDNSQSFPMYNDGGLSITLDGNGYVYVGGGVDNGIDLKDHILIQYDCSTGSQQWMDIDGGGQDDIAGNVYYDGTDILLTRLTTKPAMYKAASNLRYDLSGTIIGSTPLSTNHPDSITEIRSVTTDNNGDIYVAGFFERPWNGTGKDVQVIKFDSLLDVQWVYTLPFYYYDDMANSVRVDDSGYVYVGGVQGYYKDAFLMKLDQSGNQIWLHNYTLGTGVGTESIESMVIGSDFNPIVTGYTWMENQVNFDYYTLKANRLNGNIIWDINYNGLANKDDRAYDIALDFQENIYVIGQSQDSSGITSEFITVKYVEKEIYNIPDDETKPLSFCAIENRGQLLNANDTVATVNDSVKYYTNSYNTSLFMGIGQLSFVKYAIDTSDVTDDTTHRVNFVFNGPEIVSPFGFNPQNFYSNFYYPHTTIYKGLKRVKSYKDFVYVEPYKGIDVQLGANTEGYKIYFVVKPFADPTDISFNIEGADTILLDTNDLVMSTQLGEIEYLQPRCYQISSLGARVNLLWQPTYQIVGNNIEFTSFGSYDTSLVLVIEMYQGAENLLAPMGGGDNCEWSTFFNSDGNTYVHDLDADRDELNAPIFMVGESLNTNLPATGFTQFNSGFLYPGSYAAYYTRFETNTSIHHHTFYGGTGEDRGNNIAVGRHIAIVGQTKSTDLPDNIDTGLDYDTPGGGWDGFLAVFSLDGTSIVSDSYIAGNGDDLPLGISQNSSGVLAIVGKTGSTNFPVITSTVSGSYNQQNKGMSEGFIMTFQAENPTSTGNITPWATYFGADNDDEIFDVKISEDRKLWCYGDAVEPVGTTITNSPCPALANPNYNFCICQDNTLGVYNQTLFGDGITDMFVLEFYDSELMWSTYLGGAGIEMCCSDEPARGGFFVKDDPDPDKVQIVIGGWVDEVMSGGVDGIPYNTINGTSFSCQDYTTGGWSTITKFEGRKLVWHTLFGGTGSNSTHIMGVNISDNDVIFINGNTSIENNQATIDYCSTPTNGEYPLCDLTGTGHFEDDYHIDNTANLNNPTRRNFVAAFDRWGKLIWSTKFGNRPYNYSNAIITGSDGKLYMAGHQFSSGSVNYLGYPYYLVDPGIPDGWYDDVDGGPQIVGNIARFTLSTLIGIDEEEVNNSVHLFPNPTNSDIFIELGENHGINEGLVQVFDLMGKLVYSQPVTMPSTIVQLNVSQLAPAIYFVKISENNRTFQGKFVKTN